MNDIGLNLCFSAWQSDDDCDVLADALLQDGQIEPHHSLGRRADVRTPEEKAFAERAALRKSSRKVARTIITRAFRDHWSTLPWRSPPPIPTGNQFVHFIGSAHAQVEVGDLLVMNPDATHYLRATAANRSGRRAEGIAITSSYANRIEMLQEGYADPLITGLAHGPTSWVRCSAAGRPERFMPNGDDSDIIGYCDEAGGVHLSFLTLTENIVVATGT